MLAELRTHLQATQKSIKSMTVSAGELTVLVERDGIVKLLEFLREDSQCRFETLVDLCGADYPTDPERFEIVYHLLSMRLNQRIRVKVRTDEATPVPSATAVFPVANWYERETFDMYGVVSRAIRTCAAFSRTTGSKVIRCARTSRSRGVCRCAMMKPRSA